MYTISVIIPAYNAERTIKHTIEALLGQTYMPYEIIIINDGSVDSTAEIVENINSSTIKLFNQNNAGVSAARNLGISKATGDYIIFFDADDSCDSGFVESLVTMLDVDEYDFVMGGYCIETRGKRRVIGVSENRRYDNKKSIIANIEDVLYSGFNSPCGKLYKTSILIDRSIRFDESLPLREDFCFNFSYLLNCNSVLVTKDAKYMYIIDNSTATKKYYEDYYELQQKSTIYIENLASEHGLKLDRLNYEKIKMYSWSIFNLYYPECTLNFKKKIDRIKTLKKYIMDEEIDINKLSAMQKLVYFVTSKGTSVGIFCRCYLVYIINKLKWRFI